MDLMELLSPNQFIIWVLWRQGGNGKCWNVKRRKTKLEMNGCILFCFFFFAYEIKELFF